MCDSELWKAAWVHLNQIESWQMYRKCFSKILTKALSIFWRKRNKHVAIIKNVGGSKSKQKNMIELKKLEGSW